MPGAEKNGYGGRKEKGQKKKHWGRTKEFGAPRNPTRATTKEAGAKEK